jgi:hypothetical protein
MVQGIEYQQHWKPHELGQMQSQQHMHQADLQRQHTRQQQPMKQLSPSLLSSQLQNLYSRQEQQELTQAGQVYRQQEVMKSGHVHSRALPANFAAFGQAPSQPELKQSGQVYSLFGRRAMVQPVHAAPDDFTIALESLQGLTYV